jgi:hypothetical protein
MTQAQTQTQTKPETSSHGSITKTERTGLLPGAVHLALDLADRGQAGVIALLQDARLELRGALDGGVELAEKIAASVFRLARKGIARADDASAEVLAGAGVVLASAVQSAREGTQAAAERAATVRARATA